ncbi:MAG: penicillin-binding protein activator [Bdellovibrionaceae bacterium]|nr:penicillin-binding protein activator [Pseudobdellovibrionaceae bacterium]
MKKIFAAFVLLALTSCQTGPKKEPLVQAPPKAQSELEQAQQDLSKNRKTSKKDAIAKLKSLVQTHPNSDVADSALMTLGRIYYTDKDYKMAYEYFVQVVQSPVVSPNEDQATLGAALSLTKLGRVDEALTMTDRGLKLSNLSQKVAHELHQLRFSLLKDTGDLSQALVSLSYLVSQEPDSSKRDLLETSGIPILHKIDLRGLRGLLMEPILDSYKSYCAYRVGLAELQAGRRSDAQDFFRESVRFKSDSPSGQQAQRYLEQFRAAREVDWRSIGVALPLSGRYEAVSQKVLNGLELGLGLFDDSSTPYKLSVRDSGVNSQTAANAVEDLVLKDHVIAITGSILSKTAPIIARKANEIGVPSVHLAQISSLTNEGPLVFQNSINSKALIQKLVSVAMDQMNLKKFAILFPNDAYGVEYANLFWDEVEKRGGKISAAQSYGSDETDFRDSIKRLVGTYYVEDRQVEYKRRLKNWNDQQKGSRKEVPEDLLPPIVDFDALFVADGPKTIGQVAPMLEYLGIGKLQLLGTNLWNTAEFVRRGQKNVEGAVFVDAAINFSDQLSRSQFFKHYVEVFGEEPGLFEAQGYETAQILKQLISRGADDREELAQALSRLGSFSTIGGSAVMNENHQIEKPILALTVKDGQITPL